MKAGRWIVTLGALLFVGFLAWGSMSRAKVSCEVCLEFDGETVCRKGAGATEAEALRAAQESTCGGNARGMSESMACRNRTPGRAQCTAS
ncbi:MAG TPA: hypothetical protein VHG51_00490 [Longimicrobiaceae bacterium]|nr:hypothetical protein [Longimicrobiaceae bacterium]